MGQMNEMTDDIATSWLPSIDTARELNTAISRIRMYELKHLTAASDEVEETSLQYIYSEMDNIDTLLATYGELIDEEERNFYENALDLWEQYRIQYRRQ